MKFSLKTLSKEQKKSLYNEMQDFRHACKLFDSEKKIAQEDIEFILESARKSPSSFGMEGWKFLVIQNQELKEQLRPLCWNQPQITTASHIVVILSAIENLKVKSGVVKERFLRRNLPEEQTNLYVEKYASHLSEQMHDDAKLYEWSTRQTYIALSNILNSASCIGIDSCAIEGLEKENIEKLLDIDTTKFQLSVIIALGYKTNPQTPQLRLNFNDVVEWL
jgi:nitroreductase